MNYIYELKGQVNEVGKFFETGNSLIDLILQEQYEKAQKLGVKLAVIGGFNEEMGIDPAKASVIFGNLLNNAIDAVSKIKDEEKSKKVNLTFYQIPNKEFFLNIIAIKKNYK